VLDQHFLEKGSRARVRVGRAPIHVVLKPLDRSRWKPDIAIADPARPEVYVLRIQGQRFEVRDGRRIAEETNRRDVGSSLEVHDIAIEIDKRLLAPLDPDRSGGAHLARSGGAEPMRHDFASFEISEVGL
jgi:hypothetical protein